MNASINNRSGFVEWLRRLSQGFRFRWGEPANCGDEEVVIALDDFWDENDQCEYLGSVFFAHGRRELVSGLPWIVRPAGQDEIVAHGWTDCLGSFRMRGLAEGDYTLEIGVEVLMLARTELKPGQIRALMADTFAAAAERVFVRFHSPNEAIRAAVRETPRGLVLETQVELRHTELIARFSGTGLEEESIPIVARFRIYGDQPAVGDGERQPLVLGYVGLSRDGGDTAVGGIFLDRLPEKIRAFSQTYSVEVTLPELTLADCDDLVRSRDASEGPSRAALDAALQYLGAAGG